MAGQLELKFRISGEEVVLQRTEDAVVEDDEPEFRVQYRKKGEHEFTTIACGRAPARVRALEQEDYEAADSLYIDANAPASSLQHLGNVTVEREHTESPESDASSEYSTTSPLRLRGHTRSPLGSSSDSYSESEASAWSTESDSASTSSLSGHAMRRTAPKKKGVPKGARTKNTKPFVTPPRPQGARVASTKSPRGGDNSRRSVRSTPKLRKSTLAGVDSGFLSPAASMSCSSPESPSRPAGLAETWDRTSSPESGSAFRGVVVAAAIIPTSNQTPVMFRTVSQPTSPQTIKRPRAVPAWRKAVEQERRLRKMESSKKFHPILDAARLNASNCHA